MRLPDFSLERWFARFEFSVRVNLCASDVEGMPLAELLALADPPSRALWDGLSLGYTESAGHPELREEIAGLYEGVEADDVLVCAGAEEAIFLLANALAGPGGRAVCVRPSYQSLHEVARAAGAEVTPLDLDPARGWAPDLDRLRDALDQGASAVLVNWPHNPTGALVGRDAFREVVAMTDAAGATLVCDEVYRLLEHDPAERLPAGVEASERAVSIGVMSKAFGLAGLRIGWIATRDRALLGRAAALKDYTSICSSAPSEILVPDRAPGTRPGSRPQPGDRGREPAGAAGLHAGALRAARLGAAPRRDRRLPAPSRRPSGGPLRRGPGGRGGGAGAPRRRVRGRCGRSLPGRIRPARHARGAGAPRAVPQVVRGLRITGVWTRQSSDPSLADDDQASSIARVRVVPGSGTRVNGRLPFQRPGIL